MQPKKKGDVKLKAKKKNAFKDIEEWVLTGTNFKEASRMAGTLTENVTEERMYKAKLFDLGKERYKFISQCSYQKQRFIDTMKKKPGAFKQIMSEISRASSPGLQMNKDRVNERQKRIMQMNKNLKKEKKDSNEQNDQSNSEDDIQLKRSKTVHFPPNKKLQTFVPDGYDLEPIRSSTPSSINGNQQSAVSLNMRMNASPLFPQKSNSAPSFKFPAKPTERRSSPTVSAREKRLNKYGGKLPGVTHDHRYKRLESCLSLNYTERENLDLKDIIVSNETLNTTPRNVKESKPKIELKLITFMKERGCEFPLRPFSR